MRKWFMLTRFANQRHKKHWNCWNTNFRIILWRRFSTQKKIEFLFPGLMTWTEETQYRKRFAHKFCYLKQQMSDMVFLWLQATFTAAVFHYPSFGMHIHMLILFSIEFKLINNVPSNQFFSSIEWADSPISIVFDDNFPFWQLNFFAKNEFRQIEQNANPPWFGSPVFVWHFFSHFQLILSLFFVCLA